MRYITFLICLLYFFSCKEKTSNQEAQKREPQQALEQYRPLYHFSPDSGWMNDPNGLVYYNGEYHLYYQYNPDSNVWGPMHWGHAVSRDLVLWQELPIAIYPDSNGMIFSGSMVIDKNNTAGFGKDAFIAIFTQHNMEGEKAGRNDYQNQSIAYSLDNGKTFKMYNANPVVKNPGIKDFRDPKVMWHEESKRWVMTLAAYDKVMFYNSPDLKSWIKTGEFGIKRDDRLWECPDLVRMYDEDEQKEKWVLLVSIQKKAPHGGSGVGYFVGNFDGNTFKDENKGLQWLDYGKDNYAFVTFHNAPSVSPIGIGWMSNWQYAQTVPTQRWRSSMTIPRWLGLKKDFDRYILRNQPIDSTRNYVAFQDSWRQPEIQGLSLPIASYCEGKAYRFKFGYRKPQSGSAYVSIKNKINEEIKIGYIAEGQKFFVDRKNAGQKQFSSDFANVIQYAPIARDTDRIDFDILLDQSSIEVFANGYQIAFTNLVFPKEPYSSISLVDAGKTVKFIKGWLLEYDTNQFLKKNKSK